MTNPHRSTRSEKPASPLTTAIPRQQRDDRDERAPNDETARAKAVRKPPAGRTRDKSRQRQQRRDGAGGRRVDVQRLRGVCRQPRVQEDEHEVPARRGQGQHQDRGVSDDRTDRGERDVPARPDGGRGGDKEC